MSELYPVFVNLQDREVLLVGAGSVAFRKLVSLLDAGAVVRVVAPQVDPRIEAIASQATLTLHRRAYQSSDMEGVWLAIAATPDPEVNRQVYEDSVRCRILCNVVDEPSICGFQVPCSHRQGALQIAVSTGGISPSLGQQIRDDLATLYGARYARLLEGLAALRDQVKARHSEDPGRRREVLKGILKDPRIRRWLDDGDASALEEALAEWISRS